MQIGFDAKRLFLNNRGLGNYARNLLYGLEKFYPSNDYLLFTPRISNEYVSPALLNSNNVHVKTPEGLARQTSSFWRSYRLGAEAKKNKLDVFHGLAQELPRDIKKFKAKSVVTIHDMIFLQHPEFYNPIDRWIYYNKVKFAVHNADNIVAISQQTKNDLIETFKISEDRISVIYQSCNEVFYDKRTNSELQQVKEKWALPEQFLLYVGALNENKNVLVILEALKILKGNLDIPFVVVGHGHYYKKKLQEFARSNKLENRLIFASDIADPSPLELSSFYQMASAFIFPSYYEGFGIPILEARFSDTPVIASNSSCLEEAGGEESSYFNPDNANELAESIVRVLEHNKRITQSLDKLKIDYSVKRLMEIYTQA
jgi:glycosyltransferase involved in cell wall biosynthesis